MVSQNSGRLRTHWTAAILAAAVLLTEITPLPRVLAQKADATQHQLWLSLDGQAQDAYRAGRYHDGVVVEKKALEFATSAFGERDPRTLTSVNNLGFMYQMEGSRAEAEQLFGQALQARREVLGPRNKDTLITLDNLASLYRDEGRYSEAEPLHVEALEGFRAVFGPKNPDTLITENNLALVFLRLGRYGEAERLFREVLKIQIETLGRQNNTTVSTMNNLAVLYRMQGRYKEAEPLYEEALETNVKTLGARHPETILDARNLASLYLAEGRYDESEKLFRATVEASRAALGPLHELTLLCLNGLANLYHSQLRDSQAESLYQEALEGSRKSLGPNHPETLTILGNLGLVYRSEGRYADAEETLRQSVQGLSEQLGDSHPDVLDDRLALTTVLIDRNKPADAVAQLQQIEPRLLRWIGQELYATEGGEVRRSLVSSRENFQDAVLTLALSDDDGAARRLAASVILRFKFLEGEEEAYLARVARRSQDPRVKTLAEDIKRLRSTVAVAAQKKSGSFDQTLQQLENKQRMLGAVSQDYKDHLRVQASNLDDEQSTLPADAVLVEFRQFRPMDFKTGKLGEPHFAAMLLSGHSDPVFADLGPIRNLPSDDMTTASLYQKLFSPFDQRIATANTVYVVPDGVLNLVSFFGLKLADGRYLGERNQLHQLQTGRDILRSGRDATVRGLLALGGINFDAGDAGAARKDKGKVSDDRGLDRSAITRASRTFRDGFAKLPRSRDEVNEIGETYRLMRKDEVAEVWLGADASKSRLMSLKSPPRVLHLATHAFYLEGETQEPMLLSGIALAGANRELTGADTDGILFALEAQGLNLDGTELVVLSACDTALGHIDYSEGVFGLARALRIAGARNVLVTLWKLDDGEARDFMMHFYKIWLSQPQSDPARALRDTQLLYLKEARSRDPRIWAPYVLIE
jgi:CHAT domain-containing protein/Flp pilus assembly protein TadD